jgi:hypothetical protein
VPSVLPRGGATNSGATNSGATNSGATNSGAIKQKRTQLDLCLAVCSAATRICHRLTTWGVSADTLCRFSTGSGDTPCRTSNPCLAAAARSCECSISRPVPGAPAGPRITLRIPGAGAASDRPPGRRAAIGSPQGATNTVGSQPKCQSQSLRQLGAATGDTSVSAHICSPTSSVPCRRSVSSGPEKPP